MARRRVDRRGKDFSVALSFRWDKNQNFLIMDQTIKMKGDNNLSLSQVIGWDRVESADSLLGLRFTRRIWRSVLDATRQPMGLPSGGHSQRWPGDLVSQ
jgi:hypothetical protein